MELQSESLICVDTEHFVNPAAYIKIKWVPILQCIQYMNVSKY